MQNSEKYTFWEKKDRFTERLDGQKMMLRKRHLTWLVLAFHICEGFLRLGFYGHAMRCVSRRWIRDTMEIHGGGMRR